MKNAFLGAGKQRDEEISPCTTQRPERSQALAILGASGATGRVLIEHAIAKGLPIGALVRNPNALAIDSPLVQITTGSLVDENQVGRVIQDCRAVVCVFGPRSPYTDVFCAQATRSIVACMHRDNVQRLICQTGAMIGDYPGNRTRPLALMTALFARRLAATARDRMEQERVVINSGLLWTLVKPPRLTDTPAKHRWRIGSNVRVGLLSSLTRHDLAECLLGEALSAQHAHCAVFIKNQ